MGDPRERDPRLKLLREAGLSERWLRIAREIGVDPFLAAWRILDEDNADLPPGEREPVRVRVPLYASWLRLQRNQLVQSLAAEGRSPREIRRILQVRGCERLSERHINRIIAGAAGELE